MGKINIYVVATIAVVVMISLVVATSESNIVNLRDWTKVQIVDPIESNGAVPINIQDQITAPVDLFFIQQVGVPTALTNNISENDKIITVDSVASISIGSFIGIFSGMSGENRFYFGEVLAISGTNLTLDTPIDFNFTAADAVISTTRDLNVDGSITTQVFEIRGPGAGSDIEIDITRILFAMTDGTAMDDGTFGGIASLTNGIVLRRHNGEINNIYNIKNNGDFGIISFDKTYSDKAPAGLFGINIRSTFGGTEKHGVVIRLGINESLEILIQDDLTGLTSFRMMGQGHVITD